MKLHWLPLLVTLAPVGLAAQESIVFRPQEGSSLEKVWTTQHTLVVEEMQRGEADNEHEVRMPSNGIGSEEVIGAVDEYLSMGEQRPNQFRRGFHMGKRTSQLMHRNAVGETEVRGAKIRQKLELRGSSVVFSWVDEEAAYGKYYDRRDIDETYLPGLRSDMDLLFMLPAQPVNVGDTWQLTPQSLIDLLGKGGALEFEEAPGKDDFLVRALDSGVGGRLDQAFGEVASGQAQVEFLEVKDMDGRRVAHLRLSCDVHFANDRTEYVQRNTVRLERREGIEYLDAYLTLDVTGGGDVFWDLDHNIPLKLDFKAEEKVHVRIKHRAPMDAEGIVRAQEVTLDGILTIGALFTPRG